MILLLSILIFVPKVLVGFALAHFLWKDTDLPAMLLKLAIGVPLGLSLSAGIFFVAAWVGIPPQRYSWIEFVMALGIGGFGVWKTMVAQRGKLHTQDFSWQDIVGISILVSGAALSIGAFLYYARQHPYGFEDAWSIWNLPARTIFRQNSFDMLLNSNFYNRFHPDYPVALSLNVAWGWFITGSEISRIPMAIELLSTFTPALLLLATLSKWKSSLAGILAALVVVIVPDIPSAVGQYADPLLALHMVAAAALFYGSMKSRSDGLMLLAGLLAGYSAWVKNEGLLFIVVFVIVCLLAAWKRMIGWKDLKVLAAGLFIPILTVALYKVVVASQNDVLGGNISFYQQIFDVSRWVVIAQSLVTHTLRYANWPVSIVLILLIYAFLMGLDSRETQYQVMILLLVLGQMAGYFFIYLITPHDLELHINTSVKRLIFHVFPILILWLFVALRVPNLKVDELTG
jgi:hypothetical protein